ncbi:hypothetical protein [Algicella marina]|uniref:Uncharacterized protein n=1 Tax=Algicella marina TaxID=2683284 RepID=A0A6P1T457_9RHOB|nr:hypothetical protein [Algicella marina]QHQ36787.1 hypothetical protein GO499_17180 [Algicella marina]
MSQPPKSEQATRRKREDRARAIPVLGVFLLASPVMNALTGLEAIAGVPVNYVYIFTSWALLILLTIRFSRTPPRSGGR